MRISGVGYGTDANGVPITDRNLPLVYYAASPASTWWNLPIPAGSMLPITPQALWWDVLVAPEIPAAMANDPALKAQYNAHMASLVASVPLVPNPATPTYQPSVLNTTAPSSVSIPQTQTTNVLNPPANTLPVYSSQVVNGTTSGSPVLTQGPGAAIETALNSAMPGAGTWLESNWMWVAAGAAALFLLGGKK